MVRGRDDTARSRGLCLPHPEPLAQGRAFEVRGFVPNVVFPTGIVRDGPALLVYYGAADASTAVAEFNEQDLLNSMTDVDELTAESLLPTATRRT